MTDTITITVPITERLPPVAVSKARIVRLRNQKTYLRQKARYQINAQVDWFVKSVVEKAVVDALREVTS